MVKKFLLSSTVLILTACASPVIVQKTESYDAGTQARLRTYSTNFSSAFIKDFDCARKPEGTRVQTEYLNPLTILSAGILLGDTKSYSIGMPTSVNNSMDALRKDAGRYALFKEFVIPAGKPINIEIIISDYSANPAYSRSSSCTATGSFIPQAGHDYEFLAESNRQCGIRLYEISKQGTLTQIEVERPFSCKR